jgi:hypothetical protein
MRALLFSPLLVLGFVLWLPLAIFASRSERDWL